MGIHPDDLFLPLVKDLTTQVPGLKDPGTEPWPGCTHRQFAAQTLLNNIFKKFEGEVADDADSKALDKFLSSNERCRDWKLVSTGSLDDLLIGEFQRSIWNFFNPGGYVLSLAPLDVLPYGKMGNGASAGAEGDDFYTKLFTEPLSTTDPSLVEWLRVYSSSYQTFDAGLEMTDAYFGGPRIVRGSKLGFAFKRTDISRTTCSEPSLNMFYQLGSANLLEQRLECVYNINTIDQPEFNRELARRGSIDGSFGTIDLVSASDRNATLMFLHFLPSEVFVWLDRYRCKSTFYKGMELELDMFSSMGNGFTFPLMTILFSCVVSAVYQSLGIPLERNDRHGPGNFAVFGDDIIVKSEAYDRTVRLLEILGHEVNRDKSFNDGPFRESCGTDWYNGQYVRSVHIKRLASQQDLSVAANRLNDWSSMTGIELPNTIRYLAARISLKVPLMENDDAGLKTPLESLNLARSEFDENGAMKYRRFIPKGKHLIFLDGKVLCPEGVKPRRYSQPGHIISAIEGYIRDSRLGIRSFGPTRYRQTTNVIPSWNMLAPEPHYLRVARLANLAETIRKNLSKQG